MLSLSSDAVLFLHPLLSFQGRPRDAGQQRAGQHPPAGPAPGPGHLAGAGCAEGLAEVRARQARALGKGLRSEHLGVSGVSPRRP